MLKVNWVRCLKTAQYCLVIKVPHYGERLGVEFQDSYSVPSCFPKIFCIMISAEGGIKLSILPVRLYIFLNIFRFHNVHSHFGKRILFLYELRWKFQNDLPAPGCSHLWDSYSLKPSIRLPSIFSRDHCASSFKSRVLRFSVPIQFL